jgi:hypothetical protein
LTGALTLFAIDGVETSDNRWLQRNEQARFYNSSVREKTHRLRRTNQELEDTLWAAETPHAARPASSDFFHFDHADVMEDTQPCNGLQP